MPCIVKVVFGRLRRIGRSLHITRSSNVLKQMVLRVGVDSEGANSKVSPALVTWVDEVHHSPEMLSATSRWAGEQCVALYLCVRFIFPAVSHHSAARNSSPWLLAIFTVGKKLDGTPSAESIGYRVVA